MKKFNRADSGREQQKEIGWGKPVYVQSETRDVGCAFVCECV